jgi:hypothetical protein
MSNFTFILKQGLVSQTDLELVILLPLSPKRWGLSVGITVMPHYT